MPSNRCILYQASRIAEVVAEDLREFVLNDGPIWDFEICELAERIDLAVELTLSVEGSIPQHLPELENRRG